MTELRDNYKYLHIAAAATTQVATGSGQLIAILVGTAAAGTVTVIDNTAGATPVIAILSATSVGTQWFLCQYVTGLRITTAAASDLTIIYNPVTP